MTENFTRARNLLLGAVDTVLALADQAPSSQIGTSSQLPASSRIQASSQLQASSQPCSSSQFTRTGPSASSVQEHRRLFNYSYRPSKGKRPLSHKRERRKGGNIFKKDCICLRDCEQSWKPSSEEKMELAKMGLGLREVVFKTDGDAEYIHRVLLDTFPVLEACGGYTLLRLAENSHSMVEIQGPDSGITVIYLKDILNQAKLYIRPLQKDITTEDMKPYSVLM